MTNRLEKIGGLYVYRDGIRVLPYGNSDNDYLEIEKRRSLNAATYYFSYRRMFGAIDIDSRRNSELQEKAGREGFRENRAYRDFRSVLQNFLIQLAAHSFSNQAESSEAWRSERERLGRNAGARAEQRKAERAARDRFIGRVLDATAYIESGQLARDLQSCIANGIERFSPVRRRADFELAAAEQFFTEGIRRLRERVHVLRTASLPLSQEEERSWRSYEALWPTADDLLLATSIEAERWIEQQLELDQDSRDVQRELQDRLDRISAAAHSGRSTVVVAQEALVSSADAIGKQIVEEAKRVVADFVTSTDRLIAGKVEIGYADEVRIVGAIEDAVTQAQGSLSRLGEQAQSLAQNEGLLRENTDLKEELLDLQDQLEGNLELLQLGQAVQIVSHEFEASIRAVRAGLKDLAPWARATPRLKPIVRDLRASFAHLDGYLRLFTPLQRRLYREVVLMSGEEVVAFLMGVFSERFQRHEVDLVSTDSFKRWTVSGYPSTFYPTFVNLVDNAIYWLAMEPGGERTITLDAVGATAIIRDTGPGVRPRDRDAIFERGFSRRRGGRGLGLSLAKELLERDKWRLDLVDSTVGAEFQISPMVPES
jgi:signal transduction histidine kinase